MVGMDDLDLDYGRIDGRHLALKMQLFGGCHFVETEPFEMLAEFTAVDSAERIGHKLCFRKEAPGQEEDWPICAINGNGEEGEGHTQTGADHSILGEKGQHQHGHLLQQNAQQVQANDDDQRFDKPPVALIDG